MDEKHRHILQKSYVFLKKNIHNIDDVCDHLEVDGILTSGMVDSIKVKTPKPTAQVGELLNILPRRGKKAYNSFKEALLETENKDTADYLSKKDGSLKDQEEDPNSEGMGKEKQEKTKESTIKYSENKEKDRELQASQPNENEDHKKWPNLDKNLTTLQKKEIVMSTKETALQICEKRGVYDLSGKKKGCFVKFSNLVRSNKDESSQSSNKERDDVQDLNRKRVDFDLTSTDQLFNYMKFDRKIKSDFKKEDIAKTFSDVTDDYGCLFVLFSSGGNGFESDEIYDVNSEKIDRGEIVKLIGDLKQFRGKPKVVIIRSYNLADTAGNSGVQDSLDAAVEPDLTYTEKESNQDDLFVISSRPRLEKGPWIQGDNMNGSYFIQALIHVFKNHAHEKSFLEMLHEVNKCLANALVPMEDGKKTIRKAVAEVLIYKFCNRKELFIFPGLQEVPTPGLQEVPKMQSKCTVLKTASVEEKWPDVVNGTSNVKRADIKPAEESFYQELVENGKPFYQMRGSKKGKLIVILNVHCPCNQNLETENKRREKCREHVDFDSANITNFFKVVKFEFKGNDLLKNESKQKVLQYLKDKMSAIDGDTANSYDSLAVMVLSGKFDSEAMKIYDKDGVEVPREEIQEIICSSNQLKGKPKMLIIQTYNFKEKVVVDSVDSRDANDTIQIRGESNSKDLFVVSSFLTNEDGPWMVGKNTHGSYFIQGLIHIMKKSACKASFIELMRELNNLLAKVCLVNKQGEETRQKVAEVVILEHSEKELYLFPLLESTKSTEIELPGGKALELPSNMSFSSSLTGKPVSQPSIDN